MGVVWPAGSKMKNLSVGRLLDASLPPNSLRVVMGDIVLVGRCDVHLNQDFELTIDALDKAAYAELSNRRYTHLDVSSDGSGWGELAEVAKVDGTDAAAGTKLKLFCPPPGECHPLESFK
jgi:hypothetical protein